MVVDSSPTRDSLFFFEKWASCVVLCCVVLLCLSVVLLPFSASLGVIVRVQTLCVYIIHVFDSQRGIEDVNSTCMHVYIVCVIASWPCVYSGIQHSCHVPYFIHKHCL